MRHGKRGQQGRPAPQPDTAGQERHQKHNMVGAAQDVVKAVPGKVRYMPLHRGKKLQLRLLWRQKTHFFGHRFSVLGA